MKGILVPSDRVNALSLGIDERSLRDAFRQDIDNARRCLDLTFERAMARPYDIIGFSTTFDDQVPAAVVLARRLKQAWPGVKIAFGGPPASRTRPTACCPSFPEHRRAPATPRARPWSSPCSGARATRARSPRGARHRLARRRRANPAHPVAAARCVDLDELPLPDYAGYVEQLAASDWASARPCRLIFETSRGCWWGEKSLCSFCGLNGEGPPFRAKSPDRAYGRDPRPARALSGGRLPAGGRQHRRHALPSRPCSRACRDLADDPERPLRLFYEVKSNMQPGADRGHGEGRRPRRAARHRVVLRRRPRAHAQGLHRPGPGPVPQVGLPVRLRPHSTSLLVLNPGDR